MAIRCPGRARINQGQDGRDCAGEASPGRPKEADAGAAARKPEGAVKSRVAVALAQKLPEVLTADAVDEAGRTFPGTGSGNPLVPSGERALSASFSSSMTSVRPETETNTTAKMRML